MVVKVMIMIVKNTVSPGNSAEFLVKEERLITQHVRTNYLQKM